MSEASKIYSEQLLEEINQDWEDHGKKPFDGVNPPKEKVVTESKIDPECGVNSCEEKPRHSDISERLNESLERGRRAADILACYFFLLNVLP